MKYFRIDSNHFMDLAKASKEKYLSAKPFPHIYFDNVFPEEILNNVLNEFPDQNQLEWKKYNDPNQIKLALNDQDKLGDATHNFIYALNSKAFLNFLEELTGISPLIADVDFSGGGLHQILKGGVLKVHADFNKQQRTNLDRRINVLVYLNKDWKENYGGHFELWDNNMEKAEVKILPIFNRIAIFSTTSTSYHGHPDALNCPEDKSRKSIAFFYYTNGRPESEIVENCGNHSTLFQQRKNNKLDKPKLSKKQIIKKFIPPIVLELLRK